MLDLNAPVITNPWPHQIMDNFFDKIEFAVMEKTAKDLCKIFADQVITSDNCLNIAEATQYISYEAVQIVLKTNRILLDNIKITMAQFPNCRTFPRVISVPTFHILPPHVPAQKVHDEAYDKISSTVVYLYPESSIGTAMYGTSARESFIKEVEWKPNRAMLFCGEKNVTWHDFYSKEQPRVTLNYFVRELPTLEMIETQDNFYWKHLAGPPTGIPKSLSEEHFKLLTSGILYGCI